MNWVGGARSRIKLTADQKRQRDHFRRKRQEASRDYGRSNSSYTTPWSNDLLIYNFLQIKSKKKSLTSKPTKVIKHSLANVDKYATKHVNIPETPLDSSISSHISIHKSNKEKYEESNTNSDVHNFELLKNSVNMLQSRTSSLKTGQLRTDSNVDNTENNVSNQFAYKKKSPDMNVKMSIYQEKKRNGLQRSVSDDSINLHPSKNFETKCIINKPNESSIVWDSPSSKSSKFEFPHCSSSTKRNCRKNSKPENQEYFFKQIAVDKEFQFNPYTADSNAINNNADDFKFLKNNLNFTMLNASSNSNTKHSFSSNLNAPMSHFSNANFLLHSEDFINSPKDSISSSSSTSPTYVFQQSHVFQDLTIKHSDKSFNVIKNVNTKRSILKSSKSKKHEKSHLKKRKRFSLIGSPRINKNYDVLDLDSVKEFYHGNSTDELDDYSSFQKQTCVIKKAKYLSEKELEPLSPNKPQVNAINTNCRSTESGNLENNPFCKEKSNNFCFGKEINLTNNKIYRNDPVIHNSKGPHSSTLQKSHAENQASQRPMMYPDISENYESNIYPNQTRDINESPYNSLYDTIFVSDSNKIKESCERAYFNNTCISKDIYRDKIYLNASKHTDSMHELKTPQSQPVGSEIISNIQNKETLNDWLKNVQDILNTTGSPSLNSFINSQIKCVAENMDSEFSNEHLPNQNTSSMIFTTELPEQQKSDLRNSCNENGLTVKNKESYLLNAVYDGNYKSFRTEYGELSSKQLKKDKDKKTVSEMNIYSEDVYNDNDLKSHLKTNACKERMQFLRTSSFLPVNKSEFNDVGNETNGKSNLKVKVYSKVSGASKFIPLVPQTNHSTCIRNIHSTIQNCSKNILNEGSDIHEVSSLCQVKSSNQKMLSDLKNTSQPLKDEQEFNKNDNDSQILKRNISLNDHVVNSRIVKDIAESPKIKTFPVKQNRQALINDVKEVSSDLNEHNFKDNLGNLENVKSSSKFSNTLYNDKENDLNLGVIGNGTYHPEFPVTSPVKIYYQPMLYDIKESSPILTSEEKLDENFNKSILSTLSSRKVSHLNQDYNNHMNNSKKLNLSANVPDILPVNGDKCSNQTTLLDTKEICTSLENEQSFSADSKPSVVKDLFSEIFIPHISQKLSTFPYKTELMKNSKSHINSDPKLIMKSVCKNEMGIVVDNCNALYSSSRYSKLENLTTPEKHLLQYREELNHNYGINENEELDSEAISKPEGHAISEQSSTNNLDIKIFSKLRDALSSEPFDICSEKNSDKTFDSVNEICFNKTYAKNEKLNGCISDLVSNTNLIRKDILPTNMPKEILSDTAVVENADNINTKFTHKFLIPLESSIPAKREKYVVKDDANTIANCEIKCEIKNKTADSISLKPQFNLETRNDVDPEFKFHQVRLNHNHKCENESDAVSSRTGSDTVSEQQIMYEKMQMKCHLISVDGNISSLPTFESIRQAVSAINDTVACQACNLMKAIFQKDHKNENCPLMNIRETFLPDCCGSTTKPSMDKKDCSCQVNF